MKSMQHGSATSTVEVTNVSRHGLWIMIKGQEFFLSFEHFPWFEEAPIRKVLNVEMPSEHHLYWPELDVDLELDSITNPEKYPLVSRHNGLHCASSSTTKLT